MVELHTLGDNACIACQGSAAVAAPTAASLSPGEPRPVYFGARLRF